MLRCRGQHRLGAEKPVEIVGHPNFGWVYPHVGNENGEVANDTGIPLYSYIRIRMLSMSKSSRAFCQQFWPVMSGIMPPLKSGLNRATV